MISIDRPGNHQELLHRAHQGPRQVGPGEVTGHDALCGGQRAFSALPFVKRLRRAPPRGAIWVLVVPGAVGEALRFWP